MHQQEQTHILHSVPTRRSSDLRIIKEDTGIGISSEDIPKLFKEFGMLDAHRLINTNGTGLGLYLSKKLIKIMGGDITVESILNSGTKFIIHLPKKEEISDILQLNIKTPSKEITANNSFKKCACKEILVVDDNEANLFVMNSMLKSLGIECDTANCGKKAIEMVQGRNNSCDCCKNYKLIFMDFNMPEKIGRASFRERV